MVCEACGAQLPFHELIKLQDEEEEVRSELQALSPELMNSYFIMNAMCVRTHSLHAVHACMYVYVFL